MDATQVLGIERPHRNLMRLYFLRSCIFPPFTLFGLPYLYFRYYTMRYRFDEEGVSMRWGILFRREVNLTYARIQDIHLTSGLLQRWLGLADIHIQTASGSSAAEMKIEGLLEFEEIRDFLYTRMRGARGKTAAPPSAPKASVMSGGEVGHGVVEALRDVTAQLRATREALERRGPSPVDTAAPPADPTPGARADV
ncbi:MAG: PH domain-containing protein [Acidobacteriota bacterium]